MSLIKCEEFGHKASNSEKKCPSCGGGVKSVANLAQTCICAAGFLAILYMFFGGGIEKNVTQDQIKGYEMATINGTAMDRCIHAGMVVAACSQEKNEDCYKKWKSIERNECKLARVPSHIEFGD